MNKHTQTDISAYVSANICRWRWWNQHNVVQTLTLEVLLHDNSATSAHCAAASSAASHVIPTPVNTWAGVVAMVITDRNNGCCSWVYIENKPVDYVHHFSKNCGNLSFAPYLSNMSPFNINWRTVKHSTKLCLKCPFHLKNVLALPWEIHTVRLSRYATIKRTFEWLTEYRQTRLVIVTKSHTCHITSSLLQHVFNMSASSTNTCAGADATRQQHVQ